MGEWICIEDPDDQVLYVVSPWPDEEVERGHIPGLAFHEDPPPEPTYREVERFRKAVLEYMQEIEDEFLATRLTLPPELIRGLCWYKIVPSYEKEEGDGYVLDFTALLHWARTDEKLSKKEARESLFSKRGRLLSATAYADYVGRDARTIRKYLKEGRLEGKVIERENGDNSYWVWEKQPGE